jgi:polyvinyl alcohol dehydrogenase (cytochrome)
MRFPFNPSLALRLASPRAAAAGFVTLCFSVSLIAQRSSKMSVFRQGREVFVTHCAVCHHEGSGTRAPLPSALRQISSQQILQALQTGVMRAQGSALTPEQRQDVAHFLAPRYRVAPRIIKGFCGEGTAIFGNSEWNGWGNGPVNARFQPGSRAGLDRDQVRRLKLEWAFGFPVPSTVQPTIYDGRLLTASMDGTVYSLDAKTGCIEWIYKAAAGIRASISVSADGQEVFFGDSRAIVYALNLASGRLVWKTHVDPHPLAVITGAPLLLRERLYVPLSSGEEGAATNPYYQCCTFRGGVVALDAATGRMIWKAYTIPAAPKVTGRNALGVPTWGPSGAAVWSSPTADLPHHAIYVGTGNNYSGPSEGSSDAVLAFDINTGRRLWSRQTSRDDRWTVACMQRDQMERINCPPHPGHDYDFGSSPILVSLANGHSILLAAQKSGMIYALDPDHEGKIIWKVRVAEGGPEGGVEWGGAAGEGKAFFPISDWRQSVPEAGGGLVALKVATGATLWRAGPIRGDCGNKPGCSSAQIAPITLIPGVIFSGSMDGHLRAYDTRTGRVIWDFNTAKAFNTTDGIPAHGGSLDKSGPTVAGGMVYVETGNYVGMPGNVLLALSAGEK